MKGVRRDRTKIISEDVENEITELKKGEGKEIVMFGSPGVAHLLITMNLIDELWLFVNPVLLGKGIRLFKGMDQWMNFILAESNVFPAGAIGLHYEKI